MWICVRVCAGFCLIIPCKMNDVSNMAMAEDELLLCTMGYSTFILFVKHDSDRRPKENSCFCKLLLFEMMVNKSRTMQLNAKTL